jgi:hypothetical protein
MEPNWLTTGAPCEQIGEPLWLLCRWYIYDMSGQHYGVSSADKLSEARLVMEPSSMIVFRSTKVIPTGVVIIVRDNGSIGSSVHVFMCTLFAWWSGHAVLYEMGRWDGQMRWADEMGRRPAHLGQSRRFGLMTSTARHHWICRGHDACLLHDSSTASAESARFSKAPVPLRNRLPKT